MTVPLILTKKADELEQKARERCPQLSSIVKKCFLNTIETTVQQLDDGSYFVITGDIPAMWLRDSAAQLKPYIRYANQDAELRSILKSVIEKHAFYINIDPYSNAFNAREKENEHGYQDTTSFESKFIWERKYEIDSLCSSIFLAYEYYNVTNDNSIFTKNFAGMLQAIADTFVTEQNHTESDYFFSRANCAASDTLSNNGHGAPCAYTGMTWSGFRPSDDACKYGYLIPSNMMAVVALKYAAILAEQGLNDNVLTNQLQSLANEIDDGIHTHGVYNHPKYGKIYAYEVDGKGNYNLMDDANSPSLLSIPYIGYCRADDEVYKNTRRFILSEDNPYYYEGTAAKGIGSPHTPKNYIWHISLTMQILTSTDESEIEECLSMLASTHAGTGFMHEGFDVDDPTKFTREWFAWANTLFAQMVAELCGMGE